MPTKITGYTIVSGTSDKELIEIVETEIRKGWQPIGGPLLAKDQKNEVRIMQALIMRADVD